MVRYSSSSTPALNPTLALLNPSLVTFHPRQFSNHTPLNLTTRSRSAHLSPAPSHLFLSRCPSRFDSIRRARSRPSARAAVRRKKRKRGATAPSASYGSPRAQSGCCQSHSVSAPHTNSSDAGTTLPGSARGCLFPSRSSRPSVGVVVTPRKRRCHQIMLLNMRARMPPIYSLASYHEHTQMLGTWEKPPEASRPYWLYTGIH
ncbi:hypothetical protein B0H13DRAFT_2300370 [Mycena leptocephala]|nr:hypothetical protein B0H13DRAFT_2300370 [Mycena leptocephala]